MLAADRSLLEVNLKQSAIKLREKELNLYAENLNAMGTQAAVMAGFTTTCLIEVDVPGGAHPYAVSILHIFAVSSICANMCCVSLCTFTGMWGSGKALRGKDGSMDEAVRDMSRERDLIFKTFSFGLFGNLGSVVAACFVIMDTPVALIAASIVAYTAWTIFNHSSRIREKFSLSESETVQLDDLTNFHPSGDYIMWMQALHAQQAQKAQSQTQSQSNKQAILPLQGNQKYQGSFSDLKRMV